MKLLLYLELIRRICLHRVNQQFRDEKSIEFLLHILIECHQNENLRERQKVLKQMQQKKSVI